MLVHIKAINLHRSWHSQTYGLIDDLENYEHYDENIYGYRDNT